MIPKPTLDNVYIHSELEAALTDLSPKESHTLAEDIKANGFMDRLPVWWSDSGKCYYVVDGHHRFAVWNDLPADTKIKAPQFVRVCQDFENLEDVKKWMWRRQLGRRNLDAKTASYLRGKLYEQRKEEVAEQNREATLETLSRRGQSDTSEKTSEKTPKQSVNAAAEVAAETKVSAETVKRDGRFAKAVDRIEEIAGRDFREKVSTSNLTKEQIIQIGSLDGPSAMRQAFQGGSQKPSNPVTVQKPTFDDQGLLDAVGRVVKLVGTRSEITGKTKRFRHVLQSLQALFAEVKSWTEEEQVP